LAALLVLLFENQVEVVFLLAKLGHVVEDLFD
jgi:hypothetical protein